MDLRNAIIEWGDEKNEKLQRERGISFSEISGSIKGGGLLVIVESASKEKYPNQNRAIVLVR